MKASVLAVFSIVGSLALAQGTVRFSNLDPRIDAPFYNDQGVLLEGTNYLVQLYAGISPETLVAVDEPVPFRTGDLRGYFVEDGGTVTIYFISNGGSVWVQVRAWEAAGGSSFERAALSGRWTGISNELFLPRTGDPLAVAPILPVPLIGLEYPGAPIIVREPEDQFVREGEQASLSVIGSGGYPCRIGGIRARVAKPINRLWEGQTSRSQPRR